MMQNKKIILRPSKLYAFGKTIPILLLALIFLLLAWCLSPFFILFSLITLGLGCYRAMLIGRQRYQLESELIRIVSGILFKRTQQVEFYRIKDYIITQPLLHQLFGIMNLTLKTTDPVTPVIFIRGIPQSDILDTIRDRVQQARQHNKIIEII